MLIKLADPPNHHHAHPKPPIHTLKNHDAYNGILHLPLATHVAIIHNHNSHPNNRPEHQPDQDKYAYKITLQYPHHRACHITRSPADILTLCARLAAAGCVTPATASSHTITTTTVSLPSNGPEITPDSHKTVSLSSSSSRSAMRASWLRRCSCLCSCPCPCLAQRGKKGDEDGGGGGGGGDGCRGGCTKAARQAGELNALLVMALERVGEGRGDQGIAVPVEWFLRRRIGDCEG
ncbi:hypothetical protein C8A05DRAFT_18540 [Staphylotrichum tortipilum]|uniref:Uncharacterized protein n=1 Tax=Staphylotrichum tortipilum TaxID=2831512 RepID=A0AAN6MF32_9PEZI|nr:hypothetical protein C8A05DRAFT_18540 [Staphylotrichum longicolle]